MNRTIHKPRRGFCGAETWQDIAIISPNGNTCVPMPSTEKVDEAMYVPADLTFGFDARYYKERYEDLANMSDGDALAHFIKHGHYEGRIANSVATRAGLLEQIPADDLALEIGPFGAPQLFGRNVRYADFLSTEELRARAPHHGHDPAKCPPIHYVLSTVDLGDIGERFAAVFSSHCIEHQPDLIKHLQDVGTILKPGGRYFIAAPDKRYCFDYFVPKSSFRQVLAAHRHARKLHSFRSVITAFTLGTHNDASLHWSGVHGAPEFKRRGYRALRDALAIYKQSARNRTYVDVHGWQFTPQLFAAICTRLYDRGLSPLRLISISAPVRNGQEFCAILQKD
ncbi:class I SAM-dependent methyltransferase [Burkholderia anthina]|uniref:class I SAM-dependent methyltransferase n=1 Tax=Burkholderia anthina TaxID=179879 RepID=UPI0037BF0047